MGERSTSGSLVEAVTGILQMSWQKGPPAFHFAIAVALRPDVSRESSAGTCLAQKCLVAQTQGKQGNDRH